MLSLCPGASLGDDSPILDRRRGSTEGASAPFQPSGTAPIFMRGAPGARACVRPLTFHPFPPPLLHLHRRLVTPPSHSSDSTDDEGEMSLRRYSLDMEEYHRAILSGINLPLDGVQPPKKKSAADKVKPATVDGAK